MTGRGSKDSKVLKNTSYNPQKAPCICVEGTNQYHGTHGLMHTHQSTAAINSASLEGITTLGFTNEQGDKEVQVESSTTYGKVKEQGVAAVKEVFPDSDCSPDCLEKQLDAYHYDAGIQDDTPCKVVATGRKGDEWVEKARAKTEATLSKPS